MVAPNTANVTEFATQLRLKEMGLDWAPKISRIYNLPKIIPYEAFSSWCIRAAIAIHANPNNLLEQFGISNNLHVSNLDSGKYLIDANIISVLTMFDPQEFKHQTWQHDSILSKPEFACLSADIFQGRPIYRYCPACLSSDEIPFFRQSWRLASALVCPKHRTILRDSCGHCSRKINLDEINPLKPHHALISPDALLHCPSCGKSLGSCSSEIIDRKYFSSVFFHQEKIEVAIRLTAPAAAPSESISNEEELLKLNIDESDYAAANMQTILRGFLESITESKDRILIQEQSLSYIQNQMIFKEYQTHDLSTPFIDGIYTHLNYCKVFNFLSPVLSTQISKFQTLLGSTRWWDRTIDGVERDLEPSQTQFESAVSWALRNSRLNNGSEIDQLTS